MPDRQGFRWRLAHLGGAQPGGALAAWECCGGGAVLGCVTGAVAPGRQPAMRGERIRRSRGGAHGGSRPARRDQSAEDLREQGPGLVPSRPKGKSPDIPRKGYWGTGGGGTLGSQAARKAGRPRKSIAPSLKKPRAGRTRR